MKRIRALYNLSFMLITLISAPGLSAQGWLPGDPGIPPVKNIVIEPDELISLHIDRDRYIAGENIWFSIYNLDRKSGQLSEKSIIAYVELLNPWNTPVVQRRFHLSAGRGEGSFILPDSLSSGTYTVRAYTSHMKNFLPDNCFMQNIEIYNPFKGPDFFRKVTNPGLYYAVRAASADINRFDVNIKADTIYGRRQKIAANIIIRNSNTDQPGITYFSIAVTPAEASGTCRWPDVQTVINNATERYDYESDGHYLCGDVRYRNPGVIDSSDFLYMSVQGKVAEFRYARIDSSGRFRFLLPPDSKLRNLVLQPEHATGNMVLEIESSFSRIMPESRVINETIPDSLLEVLSGLSFNYQAAKIYGTRMKKEIEEIDNSTLKKRRFYGIPEMEVLLDDYISLPTMQEVFFELVPGIIIRERKSGYDLKITNPLTGNFYDEPPLVMIDGVIINDLKVLVDLDPETVEKIEVVKTPYLIGELVLHGIVNVITRSGDFSRVTMPEYAVILPYRVIDKPAVFTAPDYSDEQGRLSRKPDFRNTLFWDPLVKTNSSGEAEVVFWTSDLPGMYEINIHGITADGKKIAGTKKFRVR
ncbi:MAG: hypothetical protein Q8868_06240 [Bacteroidota bacterium]|nr:hypothetical protein [Bacteroidota bacterium]